MKKLPYPAMIGAFLLSMIVATPLASVALLVTMAVTALVSAWVIDPTKITYAWWLYLRYYGLDPRFSLMLALTFGIPFMAAFCLGLSIIWRGRIRRLPTYRPGAHSITPERSGSNLHGDADWMTIEQAKRVFVGGHPRWGFIPIGEAYRPDLDGNVPAFREADPITWGQGGQADILGTPLIEGALSGLLITGSGGYKTTSFTIPACATWRGSMFIMDPSLQVGPMVEGYRRSMGHRVVLIDPSNPHLGSTNVLRGIDIKDPLAIVYINEFIDWCASGQSDGKSVDGENKFFTDAARELQACILSDLLWNIDLPWNKRTVREWRARMTISEREMPNEMMRIFHESKSDYARQLAGPFMRVTEKTWSSICKTATTDTKWLSIPAFADLLSNDTYDQRDILNGRMTVIMQIGDSALKAAPGIGRVILGSLARTILKAEGKTASPIPFILDEVDLLKNIPILATLRDLGRKSGVALFPMWQSVGQIERTWGKDGKRSWYASAAWRMYAMINDQETAEEVAERCGKYTVRVYSEGTSRSRQGWSGGSRGTSDNLNEQAKQLVTPYDLQAKLRPDEAIVIPRGMPALRCGRAMFWRRPEMVSMFAVDRFRRVA